MGVFEFNILSVDWDFFFPNSAQFDWGHNENNPHLREFIWNLRADNKTIDGQNTAFEYYRPDPDLLAAFWSHVCPIDPLALFIADSHQDLHEVLTKGIWPPANVYNFDAHHDLGYPSLYEDDVDGMPTKLNCGNWALFGLRDGKIKRQTTIYPEWRHNSDEPKPLMENEKTIWHYGIPGGEANFLPKFYHLVFICRSSAWTPSWSDEAWLEFIGKFKQNKTLWNSKICAEWVLRAREFKPKIAEAFSIEEGVSDGYHVGHVSVGDFPI